MEPLNKPTPHYVTLNVYVMGVMCIFMARARMGYPSVEGRVSLYTYLNVSGMYLRLDTYIDVSRMYLDVSHVSSTQVMSSDVFSMYL